MSAITLNTFPSINAFTSPRAWFLAIIVLLHAGFVWMLSIGPTFERVRKDPPLIGVFKPAPPKPEPARRPIDVNVRIREIYVPPVPPQPLEYEADTAPEAVTSTPTQSAGDTFVASPAPAPLLVQPEIDGRGGLSEPTYPSADIRAGNEGTVVLSVLVLENGRVGEVRLEQSSGHVRLDESAMREARHWRLRPGMRDGVPVAMWKQIPVTFRLKEAIKM